MATNNKEFKVKNNLHVGSGVAAANEGGQIDLAVPTSGTTISGSSVTIDVYQDKLRFFESGGTNRGAYIPLTSTGGSVATNLLAGTTGAMNYAQTAATKQSGISTAGTTLVSVSITTNGYPVQIIATGDMENGSAGGWVTLQLYRGSTAVGNIVHAESSAASENVPFALNAIDAPAAGTYTYALKMNTSAGGTFNFGESNGPVITVVELSGPKGDAGANGAAGATGIVIQPGTPSTTDVLWLDTDEPADTPSTISVTSPITNTGTSTAAVIGLDTNSIYPYNGTYLWRSLTIQSDTVLAIDFSFNDGSSAYQITPTASRTFTVFAPAPVGELCQMIFVTSGTTSRTITFGTGFKSTGTLSTGTTSGRTFVVTFVSDGTNMIEMSRTVAMA